MICKGVHYWLNFSSIFFADLVMICAVLIYLQGNQNKSLTIMVEEMGDSFVNWFLTKIPPCLPFDINIKISICIFSDVFTWGVWAELPWTAADWGRWKMDRLEPLKTRNKGKAHRHQMQSKDVKFVQNSLFYFIISSVVNIFRLKNSTIFSPSWEPQISSNFSIFILC